MTLLEKIRRARERIGGAVRVSPCTRSEILCELTKCNVLLKLENLQRTGSYKERGALNKILTLTANERSAGLVAASAGNHAQAVAFHASQRGISAEICMPLATPLNKVMATRRYGAEVVLVGANYDEAYQDARRRSRERGLTFIHAFDDEAVIAGQGTLGLELLEQAPEVDVVFVPIGGGGLASGISCVLKEMKPGVHVVGVQSERLASMKAAVERHHPVTLPVATTLADGIAVRRAGDKTLPLVERYVDEIVTVEEEEIANAVLMLLEREKILAEGAGAAALAALLNRQVDVAGKNVVLIVSGGNMDVTLLARIIERGLVKDGRLVRLRVHLPDYPGALHGLTEILMKHRANIVATSYDRAYFGVNFGDTAIDLTMEMRGIEHIRELSAALEAAGYVFERIT
jgi:threonine dehydratase